MFASTFLTYVPSLATYLYLAGSASSSSRDKARRAPTFPSIHQDFFYREEGNGKVGIGNDVIAL